MIKLEWDAGKFFWYIYFTFCSQLTYAYWGIMTVSLTPNTQTASILAGVFYNLWGLFAGFALPHPVRNHHGQKLCEHNALDPEL
jgi:ABC-type multidrug transport system permease subunit